MSTLPFLFTKKKGTEYKYINLRFYNFYLFIFVKQINKLNCSVLNVSVYFLPLFCCGLWREYSLVFVNVFPSCMNSPETSNKQLVSVTLFEIHHTPAVLLQDPGVGSFTFLIKKLIIFSVRHFVKISVCNCCVFSPPDFPG